MEEVSCLKPVILSSKKEMTEEKVKFQKIRLFKGNKSHSKYPSNCLLILNVVKNIYSSNTSSNSYSTKYRVTYPVDAITFFSDPNEAKRCIYMAVNTLGYSFSVETIRNLANDMTNFLFSCFRFHVTSFSGPTTPTYIIMMDILMSIGIGAPDMVESHLRLENSGNYIDDSVKCLLNNSDNLEDKEFIMNHVEPLVKEKCYNTVEDVIGHDEKRCSICFDDYRSGTKMMMTPCSHKFHGECLMRWMLRSDSCPLCRGLCAKHV